MKMFASAVVAGMLFVAVQDSQAAFDPMGGNALWGKYAIQTCRSCHKDKGLTSLQPEERSSEAWEMFFVNDYKKLREMDHDFSAVGINDRQLENIHRYLVEAAGKGSSGSGAVATMPQKTTIRSVPTVQKTADSATASEVEKFDMNGGDAGKGRYIFRKCLACHKKNNAPTLSPGDRTRKAWGRFFVNDFKKLKRAMPQFDTYNYSTAQLEHLHQFLRKYALDAEKPKTCE